MSALIPLTGRGGVIRGYAIVDDEDYGSVSLFRWHLSGGYATRSVNWRAEHMPFSLDAQKRAAA